MERRRGERDDHGAADAPGTRARRSSRAAGLRAVIGIAAVAIAFVLLLVSIDTSRDAPGSERQRWLFTERAPSLSELGIATPVESAGPWRLEDHDHATGGRALVNHAGHDGEGPALAVTSTRARDVRVATRCKVKTPGTACGLVFRLQDAANHYEAHVDAASGQVSLGVVVAGAQRTIHRVPAEIAGDVWQEIAVEARADHLVVSWNGRRVIDVRDVALASPGVAGLWAPPADVAFFDELTVEPLPATAHPLELIPFLLKRPT